MTVQAGIFIKSCSPHVVEVLGGSGLDFVVADAEHAPFDRGTLDLMVMAGRAANLPVVVRVSDDRHSTLLSALDIGAAGVLVPHVDTAAQAAEIVRNTRFALGERGYSGSPRFAGYGSLGQAEARKRGDEAIVLCQIESREGLNQCEAIAATKGIDGIFIGRSDLALSIGASSVAAPEVVSATQRILAAGVAAGRLVGMFVGSTEEAAQYIPLGANWFIVGSDHSILKRGAQAIAGSAVFTSQEGQAA